MSQQQQSTTQRRGTMAGQQSSAARYLEKKKEVEAIIALEKASADFAARFEALRDDLNVVAEAAKVHGSVLAHWPHMFNLVSLCLNRANVNEAQSDVKGGDLPIVSDPQNTAERLVRVPIPSAVQQE